MPLSGIAACGTGNGTGTKKNEPPPKAGEYSIAATARDGVREGGQVVWPLNQIPTNFNYYQLDGTLRVITSGLKPDDRVVVGELWRATPGTKVSPQLTSIEATSAGAKP